MKTLRFLHVCAATIVLGAGYVLAEGNDDYWEPSGAPLTQEGEMKTINQVEPRTLISTLPFTITNSGSYYLARALTGSNGYDGISIDASHVRLDLNGFPIVGGTGTLSGIKVIRAVENISIRDGVVCYWEQTGVDATNASDVVLQDIRAFQNGWGGLYVGPNSLLERCAVYKNGYTAPPVDPPLSDGIQARSYSTIKDCKSRGNLGANIHGYSHNTILNCTAAESVQANGIWLEDYCTVRGCTVSKNPNPGIRVGSKCRVSDNTCAENTNTVRTCAGIVVEGSNSVVEGNILVGNNMGIIIAGQGNLVVRNTAGKNTQWDFPLVPPPNNFMGWVDTPMGGLITNTNPWTNFKFSQF